MNLSRERENEQRLADHESLYSSVCATRLWRFLEAVLASSFWLNLWLTPLAAQGQLLVSLRGLGSPRSVNSYNPTTGAVTQSPFAVANLPIGLSSDGTDVYIADDIPNGTIAKYSRTGAVVNASLVTGLSGPVGIAIKGGEIYEVNSGTFMGDNQTVESFSTATGAANPLFTIIDLGGSSAPLGIAVLGNDLYVVEQGNREVSEYDLNGTLISQSFINAVGTTIAGFGNDLYLTTPNGVAEYNATTGAAINADLIALFDTFGVSLSPDGSILYLTDSGNGTVGSYNAVTGAAINASLITGLQTPLGIDAGLTGPTLGIYWDIPSGGPGGTWNTTDAFWSASSTGGSQIAWVNGSDAAFSADDLAATGNFTVTLGEAVFEMSAQKLEALKHALARGLAGTRSRRAT